MASMFSANVLLFLDKFNYLDMNGGEYRFEAKIVDINTMQTISYLLIYTGKKLKPPVETFFSAICFTSLTVWGLTCRLE